MWIVRRSCFRLIVGRWIDLCLGRFGGVTWPVDEETVLPDMILNRLITDCACAEKMNGSCVMIHVIVLDFFYGIYVFFPLFD